MNFKSYGKSNCLSTLCDLNCLCTFSNFDFMVPDTDNKTQISQARSEKNSPTKDTEGTSGHTVRPSRLSLDEKVSQNIPTKGPSSLPVKKPIRKSLPKLPSQKTSLTRERVEPAAHKPTVSSEPNEPTAQETALSSETNELVFDGQVEPARATEPSEYEPNTNYVHIGEGEGQTMLLEEPIEQ